MSEPGGTKAGLHRSALAGRDLANQIPRAGCPSFTPDADMLGDFKAEGGRHRLRYDLPLEAGTSRVPMAPLPA